LHNKPIGCGASVAYAPGPDDEEEETLGLHGDKNLKICREHVILEPCHTGDHVMESDILRCPEHDDGKKPACTTNMTTGN
jgi:hypothetical protein